MIKNLNLFGGGFLKNFCAAATFLIAMLLLQEAVLALSNDADSQFIENPDIQLYSDHSGELDPLGYWTEEKLKNAIPVTIPVNDEEDQSFSTSLLAPPQDASHPVLPEDNIYSNLAKVPSTSGKLFYTYGGKNYVCSASAINNVYKNLVMTAGHCVHSGSEGDWHRNIVFAPAYYEGPSSYGLWNYRSVRTLNGWINSSNSNYDQAFLTVFPKGGRNLINVVGGNGLSWNYSQAQSNVRISGYPAQNPYNGELPYSCYGNTYKRSAFSDDAYMNCSMNGGASGGPWFRSMIDEDLGYVFAVTSRRSTTGTPRLYAKPNAQYVKNMFDEMR